MRLKLRVRFSVSVVLVCACRVSNSVRMNFCVKLGICLGLAVTSQEKTWGEASLTARVRFKGA